MLLKLTPFVLLAIAAVAIILGSVGSIGDLTTSIVLAVVILTGIAIGVHRSANSRRTGSSR